VKWTIAAGKQAISVTSHSIVDSSVPVTNRNSGAGLSVKSHAYNFFIIIMLNIFFSAEFIFYKAEFYILCRTTTDHYFFSTWQTRVGAERRKIMTMASVKYIHRMPSDRPNDLLAAESRRASKTSQNNAPCQFFEGTDILTPFLTLLRS
jgi:hypothetical protein